MATGADIEEKALEAAMRLTIGIAATATVARLSRLLANAERQEDGHRDHHRSGNERNRS
jgi:hypothetical protein